MNNTHKKSEAVTKKFIQLKAFYDEQADYILFDYITPEILQEIYYETEELYGYTIEDLLDRIKQIIKKQIKDFKAQSVEKDFEHFLRTKLVQYPKLYEFLIELFDYSELIEG